MRARLIHQAKPRRRQRRELVVDCFAGGGGASRGIEEALGRPIDVAINHSREAISAHQVNHPQTYHYCQDVWHVDPAEVKARFRNRPVGAAWFSPDCAHFSKAKGGKPVKRKIRDLAWAVHKWVKKVRPRVIFLENVEEYRDWGPLIQMKNADGDLLYHVDGTPVMRPDPARKGQTFKRWVTYLRNRGYVVEYRFLSAHHYDTPTIRKRLYLVARCDGQRIVWPAPTNGPRLKPFRPAAECIDFTLPCPSIFMSKEEAEEYFRQTGIRTIRPLAPKTMQRIALGLERFVFNNPQPFIVKINHTGYDYFRGQSIDEPMQTITERHSWALAAAHITRYFGGVVGQQMEMPLPTVTAVDHHGMVAATLVGVGGRAGQSPPTGVHEPLRTTTAKADRALVAAHLTQYHGQSVGGSPDDPLHTTLEQNKHGMVAAHLTKFQENSIGSDLNQPVDTVMAGARRFGVTAAHVVKFRGDSAGTSVDAPLPTITSGSGAARPAGNAHALGLCQTSFLPKMYGTTIHGNSVEEPLGTITSGGFHHAECRAYLTKYFGNEMTIGQDLFDPLHTVTSKARFGLVMIQGEAYQIVDIGLRMLTPRELLNAQFSPEYAQDYHLVGSKTVQVALIGNSVCPKVAEALFEANYRDLSAEEYDDFYEEAA